MGVGDTFHPTPVGVFFGGPGQAPGETVADPYFGGAGPDRNACLDCGECMTGCRHNAKNTLVKNYLYLAEQQGAAVHPLTTVTRVRPRDGGGYRVDARWTKAKLSRRTATKTFTAEHVVFAAASLGTQKLLHRLKDEGDLPRLSDRLGLLTRTNSESILGAIAPDLAIDYSQGVAITSSFHPDEHTHIEPVRYGKGCNFMSLMQTVLTDGDGPRPRWQTWLKEMWTEKRDVRNLYDLKHWSERTVIALVMQTLDNSITTFPQEDAARLGDVLAGRATASRTRPGSRSPTRPYAGWPRIMGGTAGGSIGEPFNRPLTAHFIGGCTIGDSPETGVVDPYQRVYNYPGLHIVDGSAISANLGREPVADDHRPGRAGDGLLAQQGRGRRPPGPGAAYQPTAPVAPASPGGPGRRAGGAAAAHRRRLLSRSARSR